MLFRSGLTLHEAPLGRLGATRPLERRDPGGEDAVGLRARVDAHDLHVVMAATDRVVCLNHHVCCTGHPQVITSHPQFVSLFGADPSPYLDIPTGWSTVALALGVIGSHLLQLELSAALAEGRGEDIANPMVITANQHEAMIEAGVEIPYQEAPSSGATSVSFKKAVLALKVTPQITPDDRVLLDLEVNQDTRGSPDVQGVPPINTRKVGTQVLVDNGETVVLGGIYTQSTTNSVERIPFFSDLPYVGFLFKRRADSKDKTELLIFVTPKILKENLQI